MSCCATHLSLLPACHTSPRPRWPKPASQKPEWITQIYNFVRPYSSYQIYTDRSCKKSNHEYDDRFLADNRPAHPDRISGGTDIIIAPQSQDWRDKIIASTVIHTHKYRVTRGTTGDSGTHSNTNYYRDSRRLPGMLSDSQQEEEAPTAHK